MARQYIDPQEYLDKIAALEKENAELKSRLDSASEVALSETPIIKAGLASTEELDELRTQLLRVTKERDDLLAAVPATPELTKNLVQDSETADAELLASQKATGNPSAANEAQKEPSESGPTTGNPSESVASAEPESAPVDASASTEPTLKNK